jgi:hypothetical protein
MAAVRAERKMPVTARPSSKPRAKATACLVRKVADEAWRKRMRFAA